jgi:histidinol-phosphate aminotransferase
VKNSFNKLANRWIAGLETYEPGRPIEDVARSLGFKNAGDIIKLASNENALGPSPLALKAMRSSASQMHRYPDGNAYHLKRALARKLGISPEMILPVNGSNEAIELLGHVFLGAGRGIVMSDHAFVVYALIARMCAASVVSVPMKEYTHDLGAMLKAIRKETRLVFVANPNNPTSTMVNQAQIDRFVNKMPGHVVTCFDEAYVELLPPAMQPDTIKHVKAGRQVAIIRTFSKTYGLAGLRVGYVVAPKECIELLERVRQPFNVNAMALAAAVAALEDDAYLAKTRRMIREGLAYFENEFDRMGLPFVPAVANFMLVEVGNNCRVFEKMMRKGVIVRPMDVYGFPSHVRITVGTRNENEKCIRALEAVMLKE